MVYGVELAGAGNGIRERETVRHGIAELRLQRDASADGRAHIGGSFFGKRGSGLAFRQAPWFVLNRRA